MRTPLAGIRTQTLPVDGTLLWPAIVQLVRATGGPDLRGIPAPTATDVHSVLRVLNPVDLSFSDVPAEAVQDIPRLRETLTQTLEAGYKGALGGRVLLNLDVYYERKNNFIGPLAVATPNVFLDAGSVGAAGTLANYLAQYISPAQAQQVALLIGGVSGSSAATGIPLGTVSPESKLSSGSSDILLTYRNFGVLHRWGSDLGTRITVTDRFSVTGAYAVTSKDFFPRAEVGGISDIALNAPRTKGSLGLHFDDDRSGLNGSIVGRHIAGFPMSSGVYVGHVEPYTVADLRAGCRLQRDLSLTLNIQNVLDERHREFVGAPVLGRFGVLQAEYTLP